MFGQHHPVELVTCNTVHLKLASDYEIMIKNLYDFFYINLLQGYMPGITFFTDVFVISGSWISCHLEVFFSLSDSGCCYSIMLPHGCRRSGRTETV